MKCIAYARDKAVLDDLFLMIELKGVISDKLTALEIIQVSGER